MVMAVSWAYVGLKGTHPAESKQPVLAQAPEFEFTAQDGSKVTTASLKGKIWVANFIFTRCTGPCPVMTSRLAEVNKAIGKADDVRLLSFTVDPGHDTPEVLAAYGEKAGADPKRWSFLTGDPATLREVVSKGFLQTLGTGEDGMPMHSTRFVVVDQNGSVRAFLDGNDPEIVAKILMSIGDILRTKGILSQPQ